MRTPGTELATLRIVVSDCPSCARARLLADEVRRLRPDRPVELLDLATGPVPPPPGVVGTPTYLLGDRIVSLGNPSLPALLATLDAAGGQE